MSLRCQVAHQFNRTPVATVPWGALGRSKLRLAPDLSFLICKTGALLGPLSHSHSEESRKHFNKVLCKLRGVSKQLRNFSPTLPPHFTEGETEALLFYLF